MVRSEVQDITNASILVVDDDKTSLLTTRKILEKSGYEVLTAENGRDGVSLFMERNPDLVIMDVIMPVMDGYAATQAIRNYISDRAVPILMLTSHDDLPSIEQAFEAGATDFLTKPINWVLLSQRVRYSLKAALTEDRLRSSQAQLLYSQRLAKLGYWEWDSVADKVTGSATAFEMFAIPMQADVTLEQFLGNVVPKDLPLVQQAISDAGQGYNDIQVSFRVMHHDQTIVHIDCLGQAFFNDQGEIQKITGSFQDISRLHKAETLIDYQSNHDALTDLANRSFFNRKLEQFLIENDGRSQTAVVLLDIDRFKKINDTLGQENGDALLRSVALRVKRVTREEDEVARLGSDEFAIFIRKAKDTSELHLSISRIFQDLSKPYVINGDELYVTFSMGICIIEPTLTHANDLIANANVARAESKRAGGNQFLFYQSEMNAEAANQLMLENDLRRALERNEIEVFYQPQVDAENFIIKGAEALARWKHSTEGYIPPSTFIPLAESTGLIVEIGRYVLETAIRDTESWQRQGFGELHIGVNLSGRQFTHSDLMKDVQNILQKTTLPAYCIDLEITESLAMSNADQNISILNGLKAMGVSLSIDDFGTGYSSLAYLQRFPIDTIKIDRSFIINLETEAGQAIVNTILAMAESLDLNVVAEGIEEEFHVEFLQNKNCQIFQGYKFGKPMNLEDFNRYLKASQNHSQIAF